MQQSLLLLELAINLEDNGTQALMLKTDFRERVQASSFQEELGQLEQLNRHYEFEDVLDLLVKMAGDLNFKLEI